MGGREGEHLCTGDTGHLSNPGVQTLREEGLQVTHVVVQVDPLKGQHQLSGEGKLRQS